LKSSVPPSAEFVDPVQPERMGRGGKPEQLGLPEEIFDALTITALLKR
jgi:hypothetical protein